MRRLLANPGAWLLLQAAVLFAYLTGTARFDVQRSPDSPAYETFQWRPLNTLLSQARPFGYPLFLTVARVPTPSLRYLPHGQLLAHVLAVLIFYRGLCRLGVTPWTALFTASPILYVRAATGTVSWVLADSLAVSLAIATVGLLLSVLGRHRSRLDWAALTLSLFLTYQTRASYLVLVGLVPLLGWLLPAVLPRPASRPERRRVTAGLAAVALVPMLAFCTLRWAVVGHFGLVSGGGFNLIGIAGQFLEEPDVAAMPPDLAQAARAMLKVRAELEATGEWRRGVCHNCIDYATMSDMYNTTAYKCFGAVSDEAYSHGSGRQVPGNRLATRLSWALIAAHPRPYASWIQRAFWEGSANLAEATVDRWVFIRLFVLLGALHAAGWALRQPTTPAPPGEARLVLGVMSLLSIGFALASLVLVIPVEVPLDRAMDEAGMFLPSLVSAALYLGLGAGKGPIPNR
jgi:hypothetical protein